MGGFLRGLGACGARGRFAEKNLNSHDHFERPFSFMGMKGKLPNEKERNHLNNN
jgi:hypothetical protein